jgi:periplasmic protein TonB
MEAKKNPSKDLSLQRNKFFLIGLSISISLAITAFEWRTVKVKRIVPDLNPIETGILLTVPITTIEPPAAPQPMKKSEPKIQSLSSTTFVEVGNDKPADDKIPLIDDEGSEPGPTPVFIPFADEVDTIFVIAEKNPEPVYGFGNFYQQLSKNLKYPAQAKRMGTEGKVFVEFIVNKNGEPSDLKVIKGIGAGCDQEAMRVLALTKWEPGKQRGKPVRVKMVMPISFMLSH